MLFNEPENCSTLSRKYSGKFHQVSIYLRLTLNNTLRTKPQAQWPLPMLASTHDEKYPDRNYWENENGVSQETKKFYLNLNN